MTYVFDLAAPEGPSQAEVTVDGGDAVVEATTADNRWTGELACAAASGG